MMKKLFIFISILIFSFSFTQQSLALLNATINSIPEYPEAYDTVTLKLQSYSFDVDVSTITWKVNDSVFMSGPGVSSIKVNARGTGDVTKIEALAVTPEGDSVSVGFILSPQTVDLLWEATESYVPPFYEGRSLPGEGSLVRIVAFPSFVERGTLVDPKNVAYTWKVNGGVLSSSSGFGKQTLNTRLDYLANETEVEVLAKTGSGLVAVKKIKIVPHNTIPLFYGYDSILGTDYSKAFSRRIEISKETTLTLEPYYLSRVAEQDSGERFSWSLGGLPLTAQNNRTITLSPKEGSYGVKNLNVTVENIKRRLQKTSASLEVVFDSR